MTSRTITIIGFAIFVLDRHRPAGLGGHRSLAAADRAHCARGHQPPTGRAGRAALRVVLVRLALPRPVIRA